LVSVDSNAETWIAHDFVTELSKLILHYSIVYLVQIYSLLAQITSIYDLIPSSALTWKERTTNHERSTLLSQRKQDHTSLNMLNVADGTLIWKIHMWHALRNCDSNTTILIWGLPGSSSGKTVPTSICWRVAFMDSWKAKQITLIISCIRFAAQFDQSTVLTI
jgi:hypothetical protein